MPQTYTVPGPDGKQYEVDADDPVEADKLLREHFQQQANVKAQTEFKDAPAWAKPFMAADDLARTTADTVTFGYLDKMLGGDAAQETTARRSRMGGADIAGDVLGSMAVPTGAPGLVAKIGGGPIVRGVTGLLAGTGTGAVQGGLSAAGHDQPIGPGMVQGAMGGAGGQVVANTIAPVVNKGVKLIKGVDDTLPKATTANVPGKAPNPARRVENAAYEAEKRGGKASDYITQFRAMNQKKLPGDIVSDIKRVTEGDFGTNAAKTASKIAYGASLPGMIGGGTANIPSVMAAAALAPAVGASANFAANQGTKEAVEQLRRKLLKMPKFEGPVSKEWVERLSRANRGGIRSILDED
jgi:hypothetical protein